MAISCPPSQQHPLPPRSPLRPPWDPRAGLAHSWCSVSASSLRDKYHIPNHKEKSMLEVLIPPPTPRRGRSGPKGPLLPH